MQHKIAALLACASIGATSVVVSRDAVAQSKNPPAAGAKPAGPKPTGAKPSGPGAPPLDTANVAQKLKSSDPAEVRAGLDTVRIAGPAGASAAPLVAELLTRGLSLPLTESAIDTLADVESEAGSAAIARYTVHRNTKLRRSAVKALTRTKGPAASTALRRALSDADPMVRGTAASGLGAMKAKEAVPDLFVALDHKVNEAAASIGQLCTSAQCEELAAKLGKLPFDIVTGGLEATLFREASDIDDETKVKIVGRIRDLNTIEGNKFLTGVQSRWPATSSKRVKQAIDQAVTATAGATK